MTDAPADVERRVGLLTEIRDLQRDQLGRFDRLIGMYEQVLAGQQQSVTAYRDMIRRVRPFLVIAGGLIVVILLVMLWIVLRIGARYG